MKKSIKLVIIFLSAFACIASEYVSGNEDNSLRLSEEKINSLSEDPQLTEKIIKFAKENKISLFISFFILSTAIMKNKNKTNYTIIKYNEDNPAIFIDKMVKKLDMNDNARENTYHSNISVDYINHTSPHHILGYDVDENDIRNNPYKYFEQDANGYIYIKGTNNISHCSGRFFIRSLGNLRKISDGISKSRGKLIFVYGNKNLLDSCTCLNSKKFDLANVATNHNAIETTHRKDFEKKFSEYPYDHTQGPAIMMGFPFSSFVLLHLFNGRKMENYTSPLKSCEMFDIKSNSYELNLLKRFDITTSSGYVNYDSLKGKHFENDKNFSVMIVEEAPLSLKKNNSSYEFQKNPHKMTLFIAAAIPKKGFYESNTSEQQIKKYLEMYYESLFRYCKTKKIKNALVSPIGTGVFGIPIEWHLEILNNMKNLIEQSETTYWINGYDSNYDLYEQKYKGIKFKNLSDIKSVDEMMTLDNK